MWVASTQPVVCPACMPSLYAGLHAELGRSSRLPPTAVGATKRAGGVIIAEYPSYSYWPLGVALCAALASMNLAAAFQHEGAIHSSSGASATGRGLSVRGTRWMTMSMSALITVPGLLPYVAVRTYPALAMFSNLRLEDSAGGNHWFIPGWKATGPVWARAVTVLGTNVPSLIDFEARAILTSPSARCCM